MVAPEGPAADPLLAVRRASAMVAAAVKCSGGGGGVAAMSAGMGRRRAGGRRSGSRSGANVAVVPGANAALVSVWRARLKSPVRTCLQARALRRSATGVCCACRKGGGWDAAVWAAMRSASQSPAKNSSIPAVGAHGVRLWGRSALGGKVGGGGAGKGARLARVVDGLLRVGLWFAAAAGRLGWPAGVRTLAMFGACAAAREIQP